VDKFVTVSSSRIGKRCIQPMRCLGSRREAAPKQVVEQKASIKTRYKRDRKETMASVSPTKLYDPTEWNEA
jgi:hypothetical protein